MTQISDLIQQTAERIQGGNTADLKEGLNKISKITKQQLAANQSNIAIPVQQLAEAVERNIKLNQSQMTGSNGIMNSIKMIANNLPNQIKKQIMPAVREIGQSAKKAEEVTKIQKALQFRTQQLQQIIQKNAQYPSNDISMINANRLSISAPVSRTPIQQQISQYIPILQNKTISTVKPNQIPQAMKLLTQYARLKGRIPISPITHGGGNCYVGVQTIKIGQSKQLIPYQPNQVPSSFIPSIGNQLQYHANRTINSWNQYVSEQADFVSYVSKVNSQQKRQQFVKNQFRTMNLQTFSAEALSTLVHYYVYLPFLKIIRRLSIDKDIENSLQGFMKAYQVSASRSQNPLLLPTAQGMYIAGRLFNYNSDVQLDPVKLWEELKRHLLSKGSPMQQDLKKLTSYTIKKRSQATSYMKQNGLSDQLAGKVLGAGDWSSVKRKRFIMSGSLQNPQLTEIARKVVSQRGDHETKLKPFRLIWGQNQMYSHDYVWGWSRT